MDDQQVTEITAPHQRDQPNQPTQPAVVRLGAPPSHHSAPDQEQGPSVARGRYSRGPTNVLYMNENRSMSSRNIEQMLNDLPAEHSCQSTAEVTAPRRNNMQRQVSLTNVEREHVMMDVAMERSLTDMRIDEGSSVECADFHRSFPAGSLSSFRSASNERARPMYRSSSSRYVTSRGPRPLAYNRSQSGRFGPPRPNNRPPVQSSRAMTTADREQMMMEEALQRSLHDVSYHPDEGNSSFNSMSSSASRLNTSFSSEGNNSFAEEVLVHQREDSRQRLGPLEEEAKQKRLERIEQYMLQEAMKRSVRDMSH